MKSPKKVPIRTCLGCNGEFEKKALARIVRTPEGEVRVDPTGKLPGRGAYVCYRLSCLEKALKAKRLQRALEREIPAEIVEELGKRLEVQVGPGK